MPTPPHDIEEDDGPSPLDAEGINPFGGAPFGEGPFGPHEEDEEEETPPTPETPSGETILQRHKVDLVAPSRRRYQQYKKKWAKDAIFAERELKKRKRKEQRGLGFQKIDYDQYAYQVNDGENAFHQFMLGLERQQAQRAALQAQAFTQDAMARLSAIQAFHRQNAMQARTAHLHQAVRDQAEEEEALELLMMDD